MGVMEGVTGLVGEDVVVGDSGVLVNVADDASEGVTVGVSDGFSRGIKTNANRMISPIRTGIPYLTNVGGRESSAFL